MVHEFQPRPLPTFDEYTNAVYSVQRKMDTHGLDAREYLSGLGMSITSAKDFARSAVALANAVEPINPDTGKYQDAERRRGRALYLGAMAGYALLYELYTVSLPSSQMFEFIPSLIVDVKPGDAAHNTNALHTAIVATGLEGMHHLGGKANSRLAVWSERAVTRPEHRPSFLAATGLITVAGVQMQTQRIEQFWLTHMQEHVQSNAEFDWDSALLGLKESGE